MAVHVESLRPRALHPLHAVLLAGTLPLFLGALLSDIAYAQSYQIQWTNFASWLIVGGLVFGGAVAVFALAHLLRTRHRDGAAILYVALVLATWILGFVNALVHAKDAWAAMPAGLVLSAVVLLLACMATWIGFSMPRTGDTP